jgi:NAD(P)-dependent dehydrogenase (short-subunit alcohol dehydrogenase family)
MSTQKAILITGAASGIGRKTAELFAARGWQVAAVDVNRAALDQLAAEIGASIIPISGDVRSRDGAQAIVDATLSATGGTLDCLFNCAGLLQMGPHTGLRTSASTSCLTSTSTAYSTASTPPTRLWRVRQGRIS